MARYTLHSRPETCHGYFSSELEPILTVDSGDSVTFHTLDAQWGLESMEVGYGRRRLLTPTRGTPDGHCLVGPVGIRGAEPGMTVAVTVEAIAPGPWGWTLAGRPPFTPPYGCTLNWRLDRAAGQALSDGGHRVRLAPFMGVMGMPPAIGGTYETTPPWPTGGNLDCRELGLGATLYLPVMAPLGLFSTGDGHGCQGDGEVSGMALECPMEVTLRFDLQRETPIRYAWAQTSEAWLTFGFHPSLDRACEIALSWMLQLLERQFELDHHTALALASVVVDLRITQIVNGNCGVHARLARNAFQG